MNYSLIAHILGFTMWIGGLLCLTSFIKAALSLPEPGKLKAVILKIWLATVSPGILLIILSGGYQFQKASFAAYIDQNWFLVKLLLFGLLFFVSIYQKYLIHHLDNPQLVTKGKLILIRAMGTLLFLAIVSLTIFNRFPVGN